MQTETVGEDNVIPTQNNGTLVYRLLDNLWFWIPHVSVSCFEVWRTKNDLNELYRGDYFNLVLREDITEGINTKDGQASQIQLSGAEEPVGPDVMPSGIHDPGRDGIVKDAWIVDEWSGATMYLHRVSFDVTEWATVAPDDGSDYTDKILGVAGSFHRSDDPDAAGADGWQLPEGGVENPALFDYYSIVRTVKTNDTIKVLYRSPKQTMGSVRRLKQFIELMINIYATGAVTLRWMVDKDKSGSIVFEPTQGSTVWGTNQFGEAVAGDGSTLLWTEIDTMEFERNFPITAEGKFIEFELEFETNQRFELSLLAMGFFIHGGAGWLK